MKTEPQQSGWTAPRWAAILLPVYVVHFCEEWWAGPGLPGWALDTLGLELTPERFLVVNAVGAALFATATLAAMRVPDLAWLAAALASLLTLNGLLHLLASVAFGSYSPGTVSGVLLSVPLGAAVLLHSWRALPRQAMIRAVVAGVGVHLIASLSALL